MTRFGLILGLASVVGLSAWGFPRGTEDTRAADAAPRAEAAAAANSNHDEAVRRYRSGQSNHWRHVMVGTR